MPSRAMKRRQVAVRRRASTLRALSLVACAAVLAAAALAAHRARTQGQPARTQSQLLQDGIHKMEDNGDYRGAVRDLEQASQGRDRQIAALALLYLGDAEQHLGTAEARAAYEKIIREFEDQGLIVAQARERLARLDALKLKPSPRSETTRRLWRIGEFLALGPPSFDGRWMPGCVRNQKLGSWEPAVSDVRSLQVRHLAPALADENVNTVLFSPDGSQVAALWRLPSNSSPFRYEIRVYPAAGGSSRTVSTHDQVLGDAHLAGWTADGKGVIVCLAREGATREFAQVDVATGRPKTIARVDTITDLFGESGQLGLTAPLLAMSPDGRFVAYAPLHPGQTDYDIDVLDVTTGLAHTLVGGPANDVFPLWAADGRLLFMSDREGKTDLWLVEIEDGRTRGAPQIARRDSAMRVPVALSASGSLYYRAEDGRTNVAISTLDPKRGVATVPAVVGRLQGVNRIPDWSPDGRWLAYTSDSGIAFAQQSAVLVILDAKTGDERVVRTESPNLGPIPRWSLDGRSVTLLAATPNEARFTRVDVETGAAETFAVMQKAGSQVTAFEWTPDGRAVVYARGFRAVMRFDVESRCEQTLYEAPEGLRLNKPVLSHDGTRVAVVEWGETVNEQVVLVPLDGGAVRTLFTARPGYWADVAGWDPDDNVFVVTRKMPAGPAALLRVPASGGPPLPTGLEAPDIVHPRVSRDGLHFAFTYGRLSLAQYVLENFLPPRKAPVSGDARR